MTPLPVNVLKLGGSGGKAVVFVVVVLAALAIMAARAQGNSQQQR